jgi:hypothetical protein
VGENLGFVVGLGYQTANKGCFTRKNGDFTRNNGDLDRFM